MTADEILGALEQAVKRRQATITLAMPKRWKRPAGWPRGELLCVNAWDEVVYAFPVGKLYDLLITVPLIGVRS